jgi:hypothetical protein
MSIGILYICTGHYNVFWKDFYESMETLFITDAEKHYFVFTDSKEIEYENTNKNIHRIYQENLGWPGNTLRRFEIFLTIKDQLNTMGYIFFFNANLLVKEKITAEDFLPSESQKIMACLSPGFYKKSPEYFTYDRNPHSTAYIPAGVGNYYFAGGLNGGITKYFIEAIETMDAMVKKDAANTIIALWHDESHWNKYLLDKSYIKILPPSYLYPEGSAIPFLPIILIRDKFKYGNQKISTMQRFMGHTSIRGQRVEILNKLSYLLKRIPIALSRRIRTMIYPYRNGKKILFTSPINQLILLPIAFNNVETIKLQYTYIHKNLTENFTYIVADNSSDKNAASAIKAFCKEHSIPYSKLPANPLTGSHPSGSHGLALNWAYKNIVKKYKPKYFGFLDHDIFPVRKTEVVSKIKHGVYGLVQERNTNWYLWPGFCFYDYKTIKNYKIDFRPAVGLDTGGGNYESIYKTIDKKSLTPIVHYYKNTQTYESFDVYKGGENIVEVISDWVHIMRLSHWDSFSTSDDTSVEEILKKLGSSI